jgi:hypothetical protein
MSIERFVTAAALAALGGSLALAGNDTVPGEVRIEAPTLHCLGFEWPIQGDDNRDATVEVAYRSAGAGDWRPALPLLRIGGERCAGEAGWPLTTTRSMFAGSVFDLEPGAEYEVRLSLKDPDGGGVERVVRTRTKPEPRAAEGGRRLHVYPKDSAGRRETPAFADLNAAFEAAEPGDQVMVHAGEHAGSYVWRKGGVPDRPIVIRAAGDGPAVLVNNQAPIHFDIHRADYLWFEGLTFRDPGNGDGGNTLEGVTLWAGNADHKATPGCKGLVVRRCLFEDIGVGVMAADGACRGFTITDNVFHGRRDWTMYDKQLKEKNYRNSSYVAVWVSGQGHDVAYNYVRGFKDGIDVTGPNKPDPDPDRINASIDFYNNDITQMGDDFMESDTGVHNIRIYRNRCTNSLFCGLSAQPVFGGPAYFIRNTVYNVSRHYGAKRQVCLKFEVFPAGLIVYHNTLVGGMVDARPWSNGHFRNNIIIGPFSTMTATDYSTMDHDGFSADAISFTMPRWQMQQKTFQGLKAFFEASGLEARGARVDMDVFQKAESPLGSQKTYDPSEPDLRLKPGCAAVDAGCALPNINDGFSGKAPDLGALELGQPTPHYGPRPLQETKP